MANSDELLRSWEEADELHRREVSRYFAVWSAGQPQPPTEVVTEAVMAPLRKLGDEAEAERVAWLRSFSFDS